jgi:hypothetical protein
MRTEIFEDPFAAAWRDVQAEPVRSEGCHDQDRGSQRPAMFAGRSAQESAVMTDADNRTTYERATGYDRAHEQALVAVITKAIAEASIVVDANALVFRTGETAEALLEVLAGVIAISPLSTRSPTAIRKTIENLAKRLRQKIAVAEQNDDLREFVLRSFNGNDPTGGNA